MQFLRRLVQFLFPSHCVVCDKASALLHIACTEKLPLPPPSNHPWILSCFAYRDIRMKKLIKYFKSHEDVALAEVFGECLFNILPCQGEVFRASASESRNGGVVISPIPASRDRMKRYGFNQSALLARAILRYFPEGKYYDLFIRTKEIAKQALVHDKKDRLKNPLGAFALKEKYRKYIRDKIIILVDDVSTTGATLSELRNILLAHGVKEVWAVTVGH